MTFTNKRKDSFSDIAWLLADFFNDLDLVPTDLVAGLILLRKQQKKMQQLIPQINNETFHSSSSRQHVYEFLSGVPVTATTRFLSAADNAEEYEMLQNATHYMKYALAAYGWKMNLLLPSRSNSDNKLRLCKTFKYQSTNSHLNDFNSLIYRLFILQKLLCLRLLPRRRADCD